VAAAGEDLAPFARDVEALRGLRFERPVEHRQLARADLREFLESQIETELPVTVETYMATLEALQMVDSTASVDSMLDLYDAQVLAFYDPVGHVYYSLDEPPDDIVLPPAMIDAIVVHELVHALQDQRFDAGSKTLAARDNWDAGLAYQSVLEGEALLVMMAWLGRSMSMTLDDLVAQDSFVDAVRMSAAGGMNVPPGVPAYFIESLKFPYVEGLAFVVDVYRNGGWDAVDRVHRDPPRSTEELIRPELYRERVAEGMADDAPLLSEASDRLVETTLGEFHWAFLLGTEAGRGWASDVVSVRHGPEGATVLVDSSWDDESEASEFESACRAFLDERTLPNASVTREDRRVKAAWGVDAATIGVFTGRSSQRSSD
jgi:hypothetical protein